MVKLSENIVATDPPQVAFQPALPLVKTVVSVKATVPLLQYGNIEMFVSQEIYTEASASQELRDGLIRTNLANLREHLALQILPLAETEVTRCISVLKKEAHPDAWMQRNSSTYRWLRVAAPDMTIQAMQEIIGNQNIALE